jgi:putative two-component system response regulator
MNHCRPISARRPLRASEAILLSDAECTLLALAHAVEQRDTQAAGHCERLARTAVVIGTAMRLSRRELLTLYRGGHLHDIGKVGLPDSVLFRPGRLGAEDWEIMRSHPARGEEICRPLRSLAPVLPIIRHHHERWDGGGYPDGLRGTDIPLLARVVQAADIYDALTSPRAYKAALPREQALQVLIEETGRGWRDPEITDLFLRVHGRIVAELARCSIADAPGVGSFGASLRSLTAWR